MRYASPITTVFAAVAVWVAALTPVAAAQELSRDTINDATFGEGWQNDKALMIKLQVLLDRARFSPGVIDGRWGMNTERALRAFRERHGLGASGELDEETWRQLGGQESRDVLKAYEIAEADAGGPFIDRVPDGFKAMSELDALSYTSPEELLAEKFHMDIDLLRELNPDASFSGAGGTILVTDVRDEKQPEFQAARIEVRKSDQSVRALDEDGTLLAYYPATIGSTSTPSPSGTHGVTGVAREPTYRYDPKKLDFAGVDLTQAVTVAPGPNNPVGLVWIGLDREGYGIHGTPNPDQIRRETSHGCVRLTNWDAQELADATEAGISVEFVG